jgi:hypothetical protein
VLIPVTCDCGRTFRVKEERIGRTGKCPACGLVITVGFPSNDAHIDPSPELGGDWLENSFGDGILPDDLIDTSDGKGIGGSVPKVTPIPLPKPDVETILEAIAPLPPAAFPHPPRRAPWVPAVVPTRDPPLRVIVTGVEIGFEEIFVLVLKVWLCLFGISLAVGLALGVLYMLFKSASPEPPRPRSLDFGYFHAPASNDAPPATKENRSRQLRYPS